MRCERWQYTLLLPRGSVTTAMLNGHTKVDVMEEGTYVIWYHGTTKWDFLDHHGCWICKLMAATQEKGRNCMIGNVGEAWMVINEIPKKAASHRAGNMVVYYSQNGYAKEAIDIYNKMWRVGQVAMVRAILACAQHGDVEMSSHRLCSDCFQEMLFCILFLVVLLCVQCTDRHAINIWQYGQGRKEFRRMRNRDITYTTLIVSHTHHGNAKEALDVLQGCRKKRQLQTRLQLFWGFFA